MPLKFNQPRASGVAKGNTRIFRRIVVFETTSCTDLIRGSQVIVTWQNNSGEIGMNKTSRIVLFAICAASLSFSLGCAPKVSVQRTLSRNDPGIRYYRPKPYLFISPSGSTSTQFGSNGMPARSTTTQSDEFVQIELQYLPDFSEEYSINVRPGVGSANVSLTLEQGWNLTALNQNLDSSFDENVSAVADLVRSGAGQVTTGSQVGDNLSAKEVNRRFVVKATNIPIGYYESVISRKSCGKELSGWRYVGFAPFNSCSSEVCNNNNAVSCDDPYSGPVYGMVFEKGAMTFKQLSAIGGDTPQERYLQERTLVGTGNVSFEASDDSKAGMFTEAAVKTALSQALRNLNPTVSITSMNNPDGFDHVVTVTTQGAASDFPDSKIEEEVKKIAGMFDIASAEVDVKVIRQAPSNGSSSRVPRPSVESFSIR